VPRPGPGRGWHERGRYAQVLGGELESCGTDPMTGFYRDGCCDGGRAPRRPHWSAQHQAWSSLLLADLVLPPAQGEVLRTQRAWTGRRGAPLWLFTLTSRPKLTLTSRPKRPRIVEITLHRSWSTRGLHGYRDTPRRRRVGPAVPAGLNRVTPKEPHHGVSLSWGDTGISRLRGRCRPRPSTESPPGLRRAARSPSRCTAQVQSVHATPPVCSESR
jgi:hypothetical protein